MVQKARSLASTMLIVVLTLGVTLATQDTPRKDIPLDSLLAEFKESMAELHEHLENRYKLGHLTFSEKLHAENELLAIELQIVTRETDRIAALQKRLSNFVVLEKQMAVQADIADANATDLLKAKTDRLIAQIELARAESSF